MNSTQYFVSPVVLVCAISFTCSSYGSTIIASIIMPLLIKLVLIYLKS